MLAVQACAWLRVTLDPYPDPPWHQKSIYGRFTGHLWPVMGVPLSLTLGAVLAPLKSHPGATGQGQRAKRALTRQSHSGGKGQAIEDGAGVRDSPDPW